MKGIYKKLMVEGMCGSKNCTKLSKLLDLKKPEMKINQFNFD